MESVLPREIQRVPIESLNPYPGNARRGDVPAIKMSLTHNKQFRPLMVQESTQNVVYGNSTLQAATELGWEQIDVIVCDIDDDEAERINIADNRHSDLATWDVPALVLQLERFETLDGTGFAPLDVDALRVSLEIPPPPDGGGGPSDQIVVKVGTVSFTVSEDNYQLWEANLCDAVGTDPADQVDEIRARLGF